LWRRARREITNFFRRARARGLDGHPRRRCAAQPSAPECELRPRGAAIESECAQSVALANPDAEGYAADGRDA